MTRIIPNNQVTLLQNGEAYFPVIEAALNRAVHEFYAEKAWDEVKIAYHEAASKFK